MTKKYIVKAHLGIGYYGATHDDEWEMTKAEVEIYLSLPEDKRDDWVWKNFGKEWIWNYIDCGTHVEEI